MPVNAVTTRLTFARSLASVLCWMTKSLRRFQRYTYPIIKQFQAKVIATRFSGKILLKVTSVTKSAKLQLKRFPSRGQVVAATACGACEVQNKIPFSIIDNASLPCIQQSLKVRTGWPKTVDLALSNSFPSAQPSPKRHDLSPLYSPSSTGITNSSNPRRLIAVLQNQLFYTVEN